MIAAQTPPLEATHPLIAQLFAKHGFSEVTAANFDAFSARQGHCLLVFVEDPLRVRETLDVAVIVPELAHAFAGRFAVGILLPTAARSFHVRYGLRRWPALLLLRDGRYVGAIDGLRDWNEYVNELTALLTASPSRPPTIGVAVSADAAGTARHAR